VQYDSAAVRRYIGVKLDNGDVAEFEVEKVRRESCVKHFLALLTSTQKE
jgi:hypothetical protein